jgi:hypothetical protein
VLQFVDLKSGKDIGPSLGHTIALTSVAFTADGGQILTQDFKSARSWNAVTGKELAAITIKRPAVPPFPGGGGFPGGGFPGGG